MNVIEITVVVLCICGIRICSDMLNDLPRYAGKFRLYFIFFPRQAKSDHHRRITPLHPQTLPLHLPYNTKSKRPLSLIN